MVNIKTIHPESEYEKNPKINKKDVEILSEWLEKQPHLPKITGKPRKIRLFIKKKLIICRVANNFLSTKLPVPYRTS